MAFPGAGIDCAAGFTEAATGRRCGAGAGGGGRLVSGGMGMMRLFLAVRLPDDQTGALEGLTRGLTFGRIVGPDNFHLTLAFLGDGDARQAEELHDALDRSTLALPPVRLGGLGQFGGRTPRALWVGAGPRPQLEALHRKVVRRAREAGFEVPRRRYMPHVTLARFGRGRADPAALARFIADRGDVSLPAFHPPALTLFRSHLGHEAPVYEPLAEYPLIETPG